MTSSDGQVTECMVGVKELVVREVEVKDGCLF